MGIKSSNRGGAGAGRGDNPHTDAIAKRIDDRNAEEYGKKMGVPKAWVTGHNTAKFKGSVVGHDNGNLWFTAESTGGGESDSHQIPYVHGSMAQKWKFDQHFGVNNEDPSKGRKWVAEGTHGAPGMGPGMNWTVRPARDDD